MTGHPRHPPETILAAMRIDIYASKKRDDVWIMHDRPFDDNPVGLELDRGKGTLDFLFANGTKIPLGAALRPEIAGKMERMDAVLLYLVDVRTLKARDAQSVPLTIRPASPPPPGNGDRDAHSLAGQFGAR